MSRSTYRESVTINDHRFSHILVDQHYREKHSELNDLLIVELVASLDGQSFDVEMHRPPYEYFSVEPVPHGLKHYRLVLLLCREENYIGVVNAFRVRRKRNG